MEYLGRTDFVQVKPADGLEEGVASAARDREKQKDELKARLREFEAAVESAGATREGAAAATDRLGAWIEERTAGQAGKLVPRPAFGAPRLDDGRRPVLRPLRAHHRPQRRLLPVRQLWTEPRLFLTQTASIDEPTAELPGVQPLGAWPDWRIDRLVASGALRRAPDAAPVQPCSLDLTLSADAWRMPASVLPITEGVRALIEKLSRRRLDLTRPEILDQGQIYVVRLNETLQLPPEVGAYCNTRSSVGRVDVQTRVLTDATPRYDKVSRGYAGEVFLEIISKSFDVEIAAGISLTQAIFYADRRILDARDLRLLAEREPLLLARDGKPIRVADSFLDDGGMILTVDLDQDPVGWVARRTPQVLQPRRRDDERGRRVLRADPAPARRPALAAARPLLHPLDARVPPRARRLRRRDAPVRHVGRRVPRALRRLLRPGLRMVAQRSGDRDAGGARGAAARRRPDPQARPAHLQDGVRGARGQTEAGPTGTPRPSAITRISGARSCRASSADGARFRREHAIGYDRRHALRAPPSVRLSDPRRGRDVGHGPAQWTTNLAANTAIADLANDQAVPKVSARADGGCYVGWFDHSGSNYDLRLQRLDQNGYEAWPHNGIVVSNNPQASSLVDWDLITNYNGDAVLVFTDDRGRRRSGRLRVPDRPGR